MFFMYYFFFLPYLLFSMILLQLTSFNIFSFEVLRYSQGYWLLFVHIPIRGLPPPHFCKYSLSTSTLGCFASYIVTSFLAFRSNSSSSIFTQLIIPAPYLTMETALELMAEFRHLTKTLVYF